MTGRFLGIEIGGTKLQLGVGDDDGLLLALERADVDPRQGAAGIMEQIAVIGSGLKNQHGIERIGIGFGGPVDGATGVVTKSHQINGWENMPLANWCERTLGLPTALGNDCDVAALAEARHGAGRGKAIVFFLTVGTGVGGGLVIGGRLHAPGRPAAAEIGHLRPGPEADDSERTVESIASGWAIASHVRRQLPHADSRWRDDLLQRCGQDPALLTTRMIAESAAAGNRIASESIERACQTLGWAIAQVITLVAPEVVVIGGGVSLIGERDFLAPLRRDVERYVFPPLRGSYQLLPAALGEQVVVHGAVALAADSRYALLSFA